MPQASWNNKPTVGRVIHTLRNAVEQLQRDSEVQLQAEHESAATLNHLTKQMDFMQRNFAALMDAVVESLDSMMYETERWRQEHVALKTQIVGLKKDCDAALLAARDPWHANPEAAALPGRLQEVEERQALLTQELSQGRVQPSAGDVALEALRRDHEAAASALATDVALLADEIKKLRAERVTSSEGASSSAEALGRKVQNLAAGHAKHTKSMEEIIKALLEDCNAANSKAQKLDVTVHALCGGVGDQHEALAGACRGFADALKLPCPPVPPLSRTLARHGEPA